MADDDAVLADPATVARASTEDAWYVDGTGNVIDVASGRVLQEAGESLSPSDAQNRREALSLSMQALKLEAVGAREEKARVLGAASAAAEAIGDASVRADTLRLIGVARDDRVIASFSDYASAFAREVSSAMKGIADLASWPVWAKALAAFAVVLAIGYASGNVAKLRGS